MLSALKERLSESAQAMRAVAANANIRRLELGWMASVSGQWSYGIALAVFAYGQGGATAVGLVGAIRLFPAALGGILVATTSTGTVFAVTAGIFLWATFMIARIRLPRQEAPKERKEGVLAEALAGFRTIALDRNLRLLVGLYGAQTLVAGALNVLIVVTSLRLLHLGQSGVGFLNSAVGVGGLLGALVALALVGR